MSIFGNLKNYFYPPPPKKTRQRKPKNPGENRNISGRRVPAGPVTRREPYNFSKVLSAIPAVNSKEEELSFRTSEPVRSPYPEPRIYTPEEAEQLIKVCKLYKQYIFLVFYNNSVSGEVYYDISLEDRLNILIKNLYIFLDAYKGRMGMGPKELMSEEMYASIDANKRFFPHDAAAFLKEVSEYFENFQDMYPLMREKIQNTIRTIDLKLYEGDNSIVANRLSDLLKSLDEVSGSRTKLNLGNFLFLIDFERWLRARRLG